MKKNLDRAGFGSICVSEFHDDKHGSTAPPIHATSTFEFESSEDGMERFTGKKKGYIYSRWANPTVNAVEKKLMRLETFGLNLPTKPKALLFASGMGAHATVLLGLLKQGDAILTHFSLYGGSDQFIKKMLPQYGINAVIEDLRNLNKASEALKKNASIKLLYLETPANPTNQCVDLEALCKLAREKNITVVCDNTFASPYLQQPLKFGAHYVMHSTTKYLNGMGTAVGGALIAADGKEMKTKLTQHYRLMGANANPFDAFLLNLGMKTLELRMQRHCSNAMTLAKFLAGNSAVSTVSYLGLENHADHLLAKKQMKDFGGMISFELKNGFDAGVKFMNAVQLCTRAVSLGAAETLVSHPASMSHHAVPREERLQYGITDGMIRMSVGLETPEDLLNDLEQALAKN